MAMITANCRIETHKNASESEIRNTANAIAMSVAVGYIHKGPMYPTETTTHERKIQYTSDTHQYGGVVQRVSE